MARSRSVLPRLMKLAEEYGVQDNAIFCAAAKQYALQQRVIQSIEDSLKDEDTLMAKKEYVKGRENTYAHPLVKELPKLCDSANKTAATLLDVIEKLGHEPQKKGKLLELMDE